jgi:hypothetical protein
MFPPDIIGHLQGDLYNVCSVCFNFIITVFTYSAHLVELLITELK